MDGFDVVDSEEECDSISIWLCARKDSLASPHIYADIFRAPKVTVHLRSGWGAAPRCSSGLFQGFSGCAVMSQRAGQEGLNGGSGASMLTLDLAWT